MRGRPARNVDYRAKFALIATALAALIAVAVAGASTPLGTSWAGSGSGTTDVVSDGTAGSAEFHYSYQPPGNNGVTGSWQFATTAAEAGTVQVKWAWSGLHAWSKLRRTSIPSSHTTVPRRRLSASTLARRSAVRRLPTGFRTTER